MPDEEPKNPPYPYPPHDPPKPADVPEEVTTEALATVRTKLVIDPEGEAAGVADSFGFVEEKVAALEGAVAALTARIVALETGEGRLPGNSSLAE